MFCSVCGPARRGSRRPVSETRRLVLGLTTLTPPLIAAVWTWVWTALLVHPPRKRDEWSSKRSEPRLGSRERARAAVAAETLVKAPSICCFRSHPAPSLASMTKQQLDKRFLAKRTADLALQHILEPKSLAPMHRHHMRCIPEMWCTFGRWQTNRQSSSRSLPDRAALRPVKDRHPLRSSRRADRLPGARGMKANRAGPLRVSSQRSEREQAIEEGAIASQCLPQVLGRGLFAV